MKRALTVISMVASLSLLAVPIRGILGGKGQGIADSSEKPLYDSVVEYIQTRGQQWIDTGYVPKSLPVFRLEGTIPYGQDFVIGMPSRNGAFGFRVRNVNSSYGQIFLCQDSWNWGSAVASSSYLYPKTITVSSNGEKIQCNGLSTPSITFDFAQNTSSLYLCNSCIKNNNTYSSSGCRLMLFRIWEGENLVMDLVPVRIINKAGEIEGAMYDRISGRLHKNQGTGLFVVGPDVTEE